MEKIKNNIDFSSNMDNFIVKRIIKRVDMHIASLQCTKKWSNLDYYALKDPIFSKKKSIGKQKMSLKQRINHYKIGIESL